MAVQAMPLSDAEAGDTERYNRRIMVTIALPADIERPLSEEARQRGMTPEDLALEALRVRFSPTAGAGTLLDLLGDYVGAVEGSGENVSEDTGKRFSEALEQKRRQGRL